LFSVDDSHRLKFFLRIYAKKFQIYLVVVEKVTTFAPAKQGNAPSPKGPVLVRAK
jgi:hypothetical protein